MVWLLLSSARSEVELRTYAVPIAEIGDLTVWQVLGKLGSPGRIRTSDQPVNSRLLYH
ncbi:hypothetical protein MPL1032_150127 [Mesorhizobium plurifarium]|uniref:Uncharacterized protein n=1 Tax=Mesorhizobium plurifarium TaxID=69974 RepID=A0A0K2VT18_MESPL|nr:hypothetical protein MPL1032_150127 [Mesorhizobium plurifarium]